VTTTAQARAYRERILAALPAGTQFEPLMTLYLTDNTSPEVIREAKASGFIHGVKLYPAGATTNSDAGSELAFCFIMQALRKRFPGSQPPLNELFYALSDITKEITRYGVFNFLLCNGQAQFAHCSTRLYYIVRQWPFSTAHLIDADMTIDFAKYTTPADRVAVIATAPLTDNEVWTQFAPGELLMFESGQATMATKVPIPEAVQIANAANTACT
jgi:glutamine amidotransferase